MTKNFYLILTLVLAIVGFSSFAVVNPSSVKIKVYGVALSLSADCSSPVNVFSSTTGTEVDFVNALTLGGGNPADGTYNCVMITMSDNIKVTPATTEGACIAGTETSGGVCHGEDSDVFDGTATSTVTCTDAEDKVTLYLHTGTTRVDGGAAFYKPTSTTDATKGFALSAPFVVNTTTAATVVGTFVANFTGKVVDGGSECGLNPPVFGFR